MPGRRKVDVDGQFGRPALVSVGYVNEDDWETGSILGVQNGRVCAGDDAAGWRTLIERKLTDAAEPTSAEVFAVIASLATARGESWKIVEPELLPDNENASV